MWYPRTLLLCTILSGCMAPGQEPPGGLPHTLGGAAGGLGVDPSPFKLCQPPDTDGDRFPDAVEKQLGSDWTASDSPAREQVVFLAESREAVAQLWVELPVHGRGETFTGSFHAVGAPDALGLSAGDYLDKAMAFSASPLDNVLDMDREGERFGPVVGEALLRFRLSFRFGGITTQGCARVHTFRYPVKRQDGRMLNDAMYSLVIVPDRDHFETTEWCLPTACE